MWNCNCLPSNGSYSSTIHGSGSIRSWFGFWMAQTLFLATKCRSNISDSSIVLRHKPQIINHHQRSYFRHVLRHPLCSKNAKVSMEGCWTKIHIPCERGLYSDIKKLNIFQECLGKILSTFRVKFDRGSPVPFHLA